MLVYALVSFIKLFIAVFEVWITYCLWWLPFFVSCPTNVFIAVIKVCITCWLWWPPFLPPCPIFLKYGIENIHYGRWLHLDQHVPVRLLPTGITIGWKCYPVLIVSGSPVAYQLKWYISNVGNWVPYGAITLEILFHAFFMLYYVLCANNFQIPCVLSIVILSN